MRGFLVGYHLMIKPPLAKAVRRQSRPILASKPIAQNHPLEPKPLPSNPRKSYPDLVKVANPKRLQNTKSNRHISGFRIANKMWGSPFRVLEIDEQWNVVWVGDEMKLKHHKPEGWQNVPCENRMEAASLALHAFEEWITHPDRDRVLGRIKERLAGYNLICHCRIGYPCHGDILIRLAND